MLAEGKFIESYKLEMNPEEVCIRRKNARPGIRTGIFIFGQSPYICKAIAESVSGDGKRITFSGI